MRFRKSMLLACCLAVIGAGSAEAQTLRERWRARVAERQGEAPRKADGAKTLTYGGDPLQNLDFWAATKPRAPLILFVHGGGWRMGSKDNATGPSKVEHYRSLGYAFASINYRLVPDATVEQQAEDVAAALALLRSRADPLGIDPDRIVLMGHSAGAHLVALVGTDMNYFAKAGLKPDAARGIVALDGAAYDVAKQVAQAGAFMRGTYAQAFGDDPARQAALSPTLQAAKPNVPSFLILHVEREDGTAQSEALAAALNQAGTPAKIEGLEGKGLRGHTQINRSMGDPDYPGTAMVDRWLVELFR